jgi:hypothetical protein
VLFVAFDSGVGEPPPPGLSAALGIFAFVFGAGAWVMRTGGRPERVPLLVGLSAGLGVYAVLRLVLAG